MSDREKITEILSTTLRALTIFGKSGKRILQPEIADALSKAGYQSDQEDCEVFLRSGMPVWRSKDTGKIELTKARRKIDIVVRRSNNPVALTETESDLNDLRLKGVTRRNGHYDVFSIAKSSNGEYFNSYKSLERMAAAAFYYEMQERSDDLEFALERLESITSDEPAIHNPARLPMFLISGKCRNSDRDVLKPRLDALNAQLLSVNP